MKKQIDELGELLLDVEGIAEDPKRKQEIADLKLHWKWANIHFQHAFYHAQMIGSDDVMTLTPALDDLQEAFGKVEECCKEWREWLKTLPPDKK